MNDDNLVIEYSWKDVQAVRPNLSDKKCIALFEAIFSDLEDALMTAGNNAVELLVSVNEED
jgi:hypothetical protein